MISLYTDLFDLVTLVLWATAHALQSLIRVINPDSDSDSELLYFQYHGGNDSFTCQHGQLECLGNRFHACARRDILNQVKLSKGTKRKFVQIGEKYLC